MRSKTDNFVNMSTSNKTTPTRPSLTLPNFARNKSRQKSDTITVAPIESDPSPNLLRSPQTQSITTTSVENIPFARRTPAVAIIGGVVPENTPGQRPNTPLYIPKIGIPNSPCGIKDKEKIEIRTPTYKSYEAPITQLLAPDENPWLPPKVEGAGDVKIAAITPIGTIAMVPTCDKRPPVTPRKLPQTPTRHLTLRVVDENTGETKIDPILTTAIYLDCTKPEDQDYNHVAQRMRTITENTITLQKQYLNVFKPLMNVTGRVSQGVFDEALSIYENNQVFYQDRIDDKTLDIQAIRDGLTSLEYWFACIIEPKAYDDIESWRDRELSKLKKGITSYCDPYLYQYIQPLPPNLRLQIKQFQTGIL